MKTIQACVNPRLLTKASRLFTGTMEGRICEILQNARRAGATEVLITNENGYVTVRDNGRGVDDFAKLLDLGGSGWDASYESSEDPAGVGLFCLAPRAMSIRSGAAMIQIRDTDWTGAPVAVREDSEPIEGTQLRFPDQPWTKDIVEQMAVFTGLNVLVDGQRCARESFVSAQANEHPELGCRIEVCENIQLSPWHRPLRKARGYGDNVLVNFHGQTTSCDFHPVAETGLCFLVDLTGAPTGLRLMLPARTRLIENAAFEQLKQTLEIEVYRYLQRRGQHQLPYQQYLRARELGIELTEATPTFQVGLLGSQDSPEPVEVTMPKDFPLACCYRFDPDTPGGTDADEANVHLLAALGQFPEPFVPVRIRNEYDGYSWAKLPTIGKVTLTVGKKLQSDFIWTGTLTCVDTLVITAYTSDGQVFSSPVCMAKAAPPADAKSWCDDEVLVTRAAEERLCSSEIWFHFGGWCDEGDTYDTQQADFERELDRFWADLLGPNEQLRRSLMETLNDLKPAWKSVKVFAHGKMRIQFKDQSVKTIRPPRQCG